MRSSRNYSVLLYGGLSSKRWSWWRNAKNHSVLYLLDSYPGITYNSISHISGDLGQFQVTILNDSLNNSWFATVALMAREVRGIIMEHNSSSNNGQIENKKCKFFLFFSPKTSKYVSQEQIVAFFLPILGDVLQQQRMVTNEPYRVRVS